MDIEELCTLRAIDGCNKGEDVEAGGKRK